MMDGELSPEEMQQQYESELVKEEAMKEELFK